MWSSCALPTATSTATAPCTARSARWTSPRWRRRAKTRRQVIVQVEKIVQGGSLDPKLVAIPGIYVDSVVVGTDEENMQCLGMPYDGALTGEFRIPVDAIPPIPLDAKKIIARRAAMELPQDAIVNLGTGAPERSPTSLRKRASRTR